MRCRPARYRGILLYLVPRHEKQFARNRAFSAPFHCAPMLASYGCAWLRYCSGSSGLPYRYHDNAPAFHRYPPASWQLPVRIPARCHARPSEFPPDKLLPPYGLYFASYSAPFYCCSAFSCPSILPVRPRDYNQKTLLCRLSG